MKACPLLASFVRVLQVETGQGEKESVFVRVCVCVCVCVCARARVKGKRVSGRVGVRVFVLIVQVFVHMQEQLIRVSHKSSLFMPPYL